MKKFNEEVMSAYNEIYESGNIYDKLYFIKYTNKNFVLWFDNNFTKNYNSYEELTKSFMTDKPGDEHYDDLVKVIPKEFPDKKVIEVKVYFNEYNNKVVDKVYMVIIKEKYTFISFFKSKKEAEYWVKQ